MDEILGFIGVVSKSRTSISIHSFRSSLRLPTTTTSSEKRPGLASTILNENSFAIISLTPQTWKKEMGVLGCAARSSASTLDHYTPEPRAQTLAMIF